MFTKVISQTLLYIYVYHVIVNVIFEEKIIALDGFLFLIWLSVLVQLLRLFQVSNLIWIYIKSGWNLFYDY